MSFHVLERSQQLRIPLTDAWDFFSSPKNLATITPKHMNFNVTCEVAERAYPGQIITYTVSPVLGIPLTWMTEITHVQDRVMFVDEQRIGPYKIWHHQHIFKEIPGGTDVIDILHYVLPFGLLGNIAHGLFVKNEITSIFEYRKNILKEMFGEL